MSDTTPNEPVQPDAEGMSVPPPPEAPAPLSQEPWSPDVLADVAHPIGSAYDPMPLQVSTAKDNNWMGVVALITGIIGISVAAIVFGILGLSAAKKGKATNRGMSIAGIILGAIWIVLGIVASVAFLVLVANVSTNNNADVGDCYVSTVTSADTLEAFRPTYVNCDATTNAEVYYVGTYPGTGSPNDDTFTDELYTFCTTEQALANVDTDVIADYYIEYYVPNSGTWDRDAHTVVCSVSTDGDPIDPDAVTE